MAALQPATAVPSAPCTSNSTHRCHTTYAADPAQHTIGIHAERTLNRRRGGGDAGVREGRSDVGVHVDDARRHQRRVVRARAAATVAKACSAAQIRVDSVMIGCSAAPHTGAKDAEQAGRQPCCVGVATAAGPSSGCKQT